MKAMFDGQDYILVLDKDKEELQELQQGKLEASLTEYFGTKDFGKVVSLELMENNGSDGIELKFLPVDYGNWEEVQKIQVKINRRAYNYVKERGQFGTRYGMGDKIEIMNGMSN